MKKILSTPLSNLQLEKIISNDTRWKRFNQNSSIINAIVPIKEQNLHSEDLCKTSIHNYLFKNIINKWAKNQEFLSKNSNEKITSISVDSFIIVEKLEDELFSIKTKITLGFENTL